MGPKKKHVNGGENFTHDKKKSRPTYIINNLIKI